MNLDLVASQDFLDARSQERLAEADNLAEWDTLLREYGPDLFGE